MLHSVNCLKAMYYKPTTMLNINPKTVTKTRTRENLKQGKQQHKIKFVCVALSSPCFKSKCCHLI